jgi:6-phosphogluconolactonase
MFKMKKQINPRREFLSKLGMSILGFTFFKFSPNEALGSRVKNSDMINLYVGTYTKGRKEGIFIFQYNQKTGELFQVAATEAQEASYLALDKKNRVLYSVNELTNYQGNPSGAISAFAVEKKTGKLSFINKESSEGGAPCYITVDPENKFVLTANYLGGNIVMHPIKNRKLSPISDNKNHEGSGPNKSRQTDPHAHCIILDPKKEYALAADLGTDQILIYKVDAKNKKLNHHSTTSTKPGAGPRHITFHQNGKYAYLINELNSTVGTYSYSKGTLEELQNLPMLPMDFSGISYCADIKVSPDGKFLYGSNRGHDSITVFEIDHASGKLNYVEHVSTEGHWPRNFTLDPSGNFLLVANERSNNVITFKVNKESGKLEKTGIITEVPAPVCLLFG